MSTLAKPIAKASILPHNRNFKPIIRDDFWDFSQLPPSQKEPFPLYMADSRTGSPFFIKESSFALSEAIDDRTITPETFSKTVRHAYDLNVRYPFSHPYSENTPLCQAAGLKDSAWKVEALLKAGASPNVKRVGGFDPLTIAVYTENDANVKKLLEKSASVNEVNQEHGFTLLSLACTRTSLDVVKDLLNAGANPDGVKSHRPLHTAALSGNLDFVITLLAHGASKSTRDENGDTAAQSLFINREEANLSPKTYQKITTLLENTTSKIRNPHVSRSCRSMSSLLSTMSASVGVQ